jgi:hypothetical protein
MASGDTTMIGTLLLDRFSAVTRPRHGRLVDQETTPAPTSEPVLCEMSGEQIVAMPLQALALALLRELQATGENSQTGWRLRYFSAVPQMLGNPAPPPRARGIDGDSEASLALSEAWQFLFAHMLLCDDVSRTTSNSRTLGVFRITRRGRAVLATGLDMPDGG